MHAQRTSEMPAVTSCITANLPYLESGWDANPLKPGSPFLFSEDPFLTEIKMHIYVTG